MQVKQLKFKEGEGGDGFPKFALANVKKHTENTLHTGTGKAKAAEEAVLGFKLTILREFLMLKGHSDFINKSALLFVFFFNQTQMHPVKGLSDQIVNLNVLEDDEENAYL